MTRLSEGKIACALLLLFTVTAMPSQAQVFTTLVNFDFTDGAYPGPGMALVQGADGDGYGTTFFGANACFSSSCGTVFKVGSSGTLTTLYSFCAQPNCSDGGGPDGGLVLATDGNFYGTTILGGANNRGTVFKITPLGALTTLHSFCTPPNCVDGSYPGGALLQASDGNFYGTTEGDQMDSFGTFFRITSRGVLTTLHICTRLQGFGLAHEMDTTRELPLANYCFRLSVDAIRFLTLLGEHVPNYDHYFRDGR